MTAVAPLITGLPRVNLMPRSEVGRRERDSLVRTWVWIALGAIVVAVLISLGAFAFKFLADQRLAAEQSQTDALLTEIASLSEVSGALATESELIAYRGEAMATDLAWAPVLAKVLSVLPDDTTLTGYDFGVGGAQQGDDPTLEPGVVGTITIDSSTALDIVEIIRSLRGVEGVLYADGQSLTSSQIADGRFAYLLNVEFDQTMYSGAFVSAEGEGE